MALLEVASRVRTCEDCCPSCRALAAALLEGPASPQLEACEHCGFPKLSGRACPCERYLGEPANPASEQFKELAA